MSRKLKIGLGVGMLVVAAIAGGHLVLGPPRRRAAAGGLAHAVRPAPASAAKRPAATSAARGPSSPATRSSPATGCKSSSAATRSNTPLSGVRRRCPARCRSTATRSSRASFKADLSQLSSDQARRDRYIKTNGLETDRFPNATFVLTDPISFEAPAPGAVVEHQRDRRSHDSRRDQAGERSR